MNQYEIECRSLVEAIGAFENNVGFRLISIFPAEAPRVAVLSNGRKEVRIVENSDANLIGSLNNLDWENFRIDFEEPQIDVPRPNLSNRVFNPADQTETTGRAGMTYHDLFPGHFGGYLIGSRIKIPGTGTVPDYVHFHKLVFQVLYCLNGTAKLVYEDQGEPFLFEKGDIILQPPQIRHRVLESFDDLEVLEFSCPAEHHTFREHQLELPTPKNLTREYAGQRFLYEKNFQGDGSLRNASNGLINAEVIRIEKHKPLTVRNPRFTVGYVIEGAGKLHLDDETMLVEKYSAFSFVQEFVIETRDSCTVFLLTLNTEKIRKAS